MRTPRVIAFRVDASLEMGIGHVMRCLTLADALATCQFSCHFICRDHKGHLASIISRRGHEVHLLSNAGANWLKIPSDGSKYIHWLAVPSQRDAVETATVLANLNPRWLVVDHYALDATWEHFVAPHVRHIMVIDDLANRRHYGQILLDQTLGRNAADYAALMPEGSRLLCGSSYALLRPGFAALRVQSLRRRQRNEMRRILVSMGGADAANITGQVVEALGRTRLPEPCRITIVMGPQAPWLDEIKRSVARSPLDAEVLTGVEDMPRLMADSDFAIGGAGATSWERCCLGLPTIMVIMAENQRFAAFNLEAAGAATVLDSSGPALLSDISNATNQLLCAETRSAMSKCAREVADGDGTRRIVDAMTAAEGHIGAGNG